jgi:hypothetical protein
MAKQAADSADRFANVQSWNAVSNGSTPSGARRSAKNGGFRNGSVMWLGNATTPYVCATAAYLLWS